MKCRIDYEWTSRSVLLLLLLFLGAVVAHPNRIIIKVYPRKSFKHVKNVAMQNKTLLCLQKV
jgi:hypothetical protein